MSGGEFKTLAGSKSRLLGATKDLSLRWAETREHWHDGKSREFHERYLLELFARVDRTSTIIDKLNELMRKIQADCE